MTEVFWKSYERRNAGPYTWLTTSLHIPVDTLIAIGNDDECDDNNTKQRPTVYIAIADRMTWHRDIGAHNAWRLLSRRFDLNNL